MLTGRVESKNEKKNEKKTEKNLRMPKGALLQNEKPSATDRSEN